MSDAMRILHFVPKDCMPVNTGAKLRNYYFARELAAKAKVTYLSFAENSNGNQNPSSTSKDKTFAPLENFCEQVITLPHENSYSMSKMVRGLVGRYPLTVLNYTTDAMAERLKQTLEEIDQVLKGDEAMVVMAQLDGYTPQQIQETVGLTPTQYASTLRAIRRKLDKLENKESLK